MTGTRPQHHVPRYHVRPPRGYLNDPNGPVLLGGTLHLYFQYRLTTDMAEPVMWGHASSEDFATWTLHRPAMAPSPVALDRDGCWSGNTVLGPGGRVHAFYSGLREEHPYQSVLTAVSADGGASFGPPIQVVRDPESTVRTFRDPFVWRDDEGWAMVVGAGDDAEVASIRLYRSRDLERWSFVRTVAQLPRTTIGDDDTGAMWECPQILSFGDATIALVGAWAAEVGTMRVWATEISLRKEVPARILHPLDDGPDFYAASVLREGPHGPVVWGWVTEARSAAWWRDDGWAGTLSLPRAVTWEDDRVCSSPVASLSGLRLGPAAVVGDGGSLVIGAQTEIIVRAADGGRSDVRIAFGDEEWVDLELDSASRTTTIRRDRSSADARAESSDVAIADSGDEDGFELRVFLDGSVLEVFTSTGRVATLRVYPVTPPPWRLVVTGGAELEVWSLAAALVPGADLAGEPEEESAAGDAA